MDKFWLVLISICVVGFSSLNLGMYAIVYDGWFMNQEYLLLIGISSIGGILCLIPFSNERQNMQTTKPILDEVKQP